MNKIKNIIKIIAIASLTLLANGCITDSTNEATVATSSAVGSSSSNGSSSSAITAAQDSAGNALAVAYLAILGKSVVKVVDSGLVDAHVLLFNPIKSTWVPFDSVCLQVTTLLPDTINPAYYKFLQHAMDSLQAKGDSGRYSEMLDVYNVSIITSCQLSNTSAIEFTGNPLDIQITQGRTVAGVTLNTTTTIDSASANYFIQEIMRMNQVIGSGINNSDMIVHQ